MKKEEIYWKQRSRVQWLADGDRNTAFFHRSASIHKRRNTIAVIKDEGGNEVTEKDKINLVVVNYFRDLYSNVGLICPDNIQNELLDHIQSAIMLSDNNMLMERVSDEEVRKAVFAMGGYKAPGPDGFPLLFFQEYWDIVGTDVI